MEEIEYIDSEKRKDLRVVFGGSCCEDSITDLSTSVFTIYSTRLAHILSTRFASERTSQDYLIKDATHPTFLIIATKYQGFRRDLQNYRQELYRDL